jgi:riboflavin synthase
MATPVISQSELAFGIHLCMIAKKHALGAEMFTGLIERKGIIKVLTREGGSGSLRIATGDWDRAIEIGESMAVMGICLTVTDFQNGVLCFDVLGETFRCTNLGEKQVGQPVNLERALRQGDSLGGHMVQGHVDGLGSVAAILPIDADYRVQITCPPDILRYVVYKGSVAVDGISLTVAAVDETSFTVHIIPHTWSVTTFGKMKEGDTVNLEADPLAKYVEKALASGKTLLPIDWQAIQQSGYDQLRQ